MLIWTGEAWVNLNRVTSQADTRSKHAAAYLAALQEFLADKEARFVENGAVKYRQTAGRFQLSSF